MGKKKAIPKKRDVETPSRPEPETKAPSKEFTFVSRDNSQEVKMDAPVKKNKASKVLFHVLNHGVMPNGLKLQWAESYKGHFINRKGKNACGASAAPNLLVVNGIADELKAIGVKGIIQPADSKPYQAIKLDGKDKDELKDLAKQIARVLGFGKKAKKETSPTAESVA